MTAPLYRAVDQYSGTIAEATQQIDQLTRQRDDARAERDNMVDLAIEVGRLGTYLRHAIADRDDIREELDEMRERYDAAQCRMDEMVEELRELRAVR